MSSDSDVVKRVVVTGLGVVAPNGIGLAEFESALRAGRSGIRRVEKMGEVNASCQVAGVPQGVDEIAADYFTADELFAMNSSHKMGSIAAVDAWGDAGLARPTSDGDVDWDTGALLGTGIGGADTMGDWVVPMTNAGKVRRLGSTCVEKVMASGPSARVAGLLGLGNLVSSNSSACSTGVEAVIMGLRHLRHGLAKRMLCGGTEGASHYVWSAFDAMRVLCRDSNDDPERASRPLSATAGGFVPSAGAGVLVLETLESASARGARIYAEVLGGMLNCGGQRHGGSMTAPNPESVTRCIRGAILDAGVDPREIDGINAHATGTFADAQEIRNWSRALERGPGDLPPVTATKSMIGHLLGAAGGVESVATVLMLHRRFLHPSVNCEKLHEDIEPFAGSINRETRDVEDLDVMIKAGFGFGDVNSCVLFRRWSGARA